MQEALNRVVERRDFENEVAVHLGVKHAIGINSGSDAFRIALVAIGLRQGEEVITTPFCFASDAVVMEKG